MSNPMKIVGESEIKIRQEKGRDDAKIRAAWEAYHGPEWPRRLLPNVAPAFARGYRDGAESIAAEVRSVLEQLDHVAEVWGDEGVFRTCRDRLRAAVSRDHPGADLA